MINIYTILLILAMHFVADFMLQSGYMAVNKSKSNKVLAYHVTVYSICFIPVFGIYFALINWLLHFATDYVSSRINSKLWEEAMEFLKVGKFKEASNKFHWFFACVGFDQFIHFACLFITYKLIIGV